MPDAPPIFRPHGRLPARAAHERERGSARERGYDARWGRDSKAHLRANLLCRYCELEGIVTAATLVDHLYPHRGDKHLFWLKQYWISSCAHCHNTFKKQIEAQGRAAIDALAKLLGLPPLTSAMG